MTARATLSTIRNASLAGIVLAGLAGHTHAQITPVPSPFAGQFTENFEGYSSLVPVQCFRPASGVFQSTATLCTYNISTGNLVTGLTARNGGWSQSCTISAFQGTNFCGNSTPSSVIGINFNNAAGRFGGYFGTNRSGPAAAGGTIEFYDESSGLIGTDFLNLGPCGNGGWKWHGWESTRPIKRIRIYANGADTYTVTLDLLNYDPPVPCTPPSITSNPADASRAQGETVVFFVGADGTGPLGYVWRLNGSTLSDGPAAGGGFISGATTNTLTITGVGPADAGSYDVIVTNTCGSAQSQAAVLTVQTPTGCDPDVNCDGSADGFDVEAMEQAVGGDFSNFCQFDADFNGDGSVDGFDVEAVEQVVGGAPCP